MTLKFSIVAAAIVFQSFIHGLVQFNNRREIVFIFYKKMLSPFAIPNERFTSPIFLNNTTISNGTPTSKSLQRLTILGLNPPKIRLNSVPELSLCSIVPNA